MRMIPREPFETGSQAEKLVFDRLERTFDDRYFGCHSLKPTIHPRKRFPEVDFVICGPVGLFVLEVKGGRVSCQDGLWQCQDRGSQVTLLTESPFRQAETALHGLLDTLRPNLPDGINDCLVSGYGVMFPDCDWRACGAEWDPAMLADRRRSRDMEKWLGGLFEYWRQRGATKKQLSVDAVGTIQRFLRPDVNATADPGNQRFPIPDRVADAGGSITELTDDQLSIVGLIDKNRRVLCTGGAGTGKTFMAEWLARHWTSNHLQVALVCRSPWLRHHLQSRLPIPRLNVSLIDGVRLDCIRTGLNQFDALIIDEGQDLFEVAAMEAMDDVLDGGLEAGRWCWFQDSNNLTSAYHNDRQAQEFLESANHVQTSLHVNHRNTGPILKCIQEVLGTDVGMLGKGTGPDIRWHAVTNRRESAVRIARKLLILWTSAGLYQVQ